MNGCVGHTICCPPICCPPQYCVRDFYTQRIIPVIHPVVTINRQNIVNVPQHYYQPTSRNVVVDPGYQGSQGYQDYQGYQGYQDCQGYQGHSGCGTCGSHSNRLFFR
ncbi:MAG TPA: spore coat protein D [Desulfitobacteriaceae bacterium]|nr:spore coat protein D [Desulfitobacteriaceae bacterium]